MEVFNIFGNTGKFLAGIRDHCLKRNASAEATTDPSYKQIFVWKHMFTGNESLVSRNLI